MKRSIISRKDLLRLQIILNCFGGSGFFRIFAVEDCETRLRLSRSALPLATEGTQELEHAPLHSACTRLAVDSVDLRKRALGQDIVEQPCGHCHTGLSQPRKDKPQGKKDVFRTLSSADSTSQLETLSEGIATKRPRRVYSIPMFGSHYWLPALPI